MANEILYSGLGDLRLAETLNRLVLLSLADRYILQNHPALIQVGDITGSGSTTIKTSEIAHYGAVQLASVAENAGPSNSALVDASHTVAVGRYAKQMQVSGLASITDSLGMFSNPAFWVQDSIMSKGMTLTSMIAAQVGQFTASKGVSGADLTLTQYFDALTALELAKVQGAKMAVLHPQQWHDLQAALRAASGTIAYNPATAEQIAVRGDNFKGNLYGADVFISHQVPTANAGADRAGGVFGAGAILWAEGTPIIPKSAPAALVANKTLVAMGYDETLDVETVVTSAYMGVSQGIDAAGCAIVSDA